MIDNSQIALRIEMYLPPTQGGLRNHESGSVLRKMQRKKLILSIIPFAVVGIIGIYLHQLSKATRAEELGRLIDEPIRKIQVIDSFSSAYGGQISISQILFQPAGFYNESEISRLAGGKQKPYDELCIGHLRIIIPAKARDWSNSGQTAWYLVGVQDSSRELLIKKAGLVFTPRHGFTDESAFSVVTTFDGSRITVLEHDLKLETNASTLKMSGQQFDLFGQPMVILLDSSHNVVSTHPQP